MGKKIISYILLFPLIITLFATCISLTIEKTLFSEQYVENILEKCDYYNKTYSDIMENFKNNTIQSGLTEDVLNNIITKEQVKNDVNKTISYLYGKEEKQKIDIDSIEEKLKTNIDEQIKANNKVVTKDEQEAIDVYVGTILNIYKSGITYNEEAINTIHNSITNYSKILNKAKIAIIILAVIILIITVIINKKESFNYISIALFGNAVLLIFLKLAEKFVLNINNILILNQAFSDFIICAINSIMISILITGIVSLILGIIITVIDQNLRK